MLGMGVQKEREEEKHCEYRGEASRSRDVVRSNKDTRTYTIKTKKKEEENEEKQRQGDKIP